VAVVERARDDLQGAGVRRLGTIAVTAACGLGLVAAPARASRTPSKSESAAIKRVAMKACRSDAGPCRWHGARVSTKSSRYAWADVTNEGFSGVLVRRTSVSPKRFKVVGVQGGGIGECSYWRKRAPRSVLKDLKVYGLLDAATGESGICG
jgi:hypothetical protein